MIHGNKLEMAVYIGRLDRHVGQTILVDSLSPPPNKALYFTDQEAVSDHVHGRSCGNTSDELASCDKQSHSHISLTVGGSKHRKGFNGVGHIASKVGCPFVYYTGETQAAGGRRPRPLTRVGSATPLDTVAPRRAARAFPIAAHTTRRAQPLDRLATAL
ncbi:unnamed protein product [Euphydryas editha]|uniref:Uncharacterized protein n=1 Tax=Euphydryas editha TaxID=104508 RepID=A0AAU9THS7_EUPED|nr:unnamed protein product [Euphydryas editha]